ncbi:hypothetical protein ANN_07938 [Periplaneta americana]|uniref:Uncharacterized protein n=1 Tax=Periplaneta americana TaxID=6978 RepID=A0ABQ8T005_PERAM|nr:hypothetical protein ANN_07938 [Periplaneta americana]
MAGLCEGRNEPPEAVTPLRTSSWRGAATVSCLRSGALWEAKSFPEIIACVQCTLLQAKRDGRVYITGTLFASS